MPEVVDSQQQSDAFETNKPVTPPAPWDQRELACLYEILQIVRDAEIIEIDALSRIVQALIQHAPHPAACGVRLRYEANIIEEGNLIEPAQWRTWPIVNECEEMGMLETATPVAEKDAIQAVWPSSLLSEAITGLLRQRGAVHAKPESLAPRREHLDQADKMSTLSNFVAGLAHEVGNPINIAQLSLQTLRWAWDEACPLLDRYQEENDHFMIGYLPYTEFRQEAPVLFTNIAESLDRVQSTIRELRDYVRWRPSDQREIVDLRMVIESAALLLRGRIRKATNRFSMQMPKTLPSVHGNYQQLEQVMINLIQNACQALPSMDKGIEITAGTENGGRDIVVVITDEGAGIAPEHLSHITEPFFTTRRHLGAGGLGLFVCLNLVQDHGGTLSFRSFPGEGCTVEMRLPATENSEHACWVFEPGSAPVLEGR